MNSYYRSIFTILFLAVGSILVFAIWSNIHAYAQQSSSPTLSASSSPSTSSHSTTTISPELKAKMCNPNNPSLKFVNATESRICGIPVTVKPSTLSATAQQTTTSPSSAEAPLAQLYKSTGSRNNTGVTTTTTNSPIVLRPLPGGTCPTAYHLVSGAVCIKDLPTAVTTKTIPTASIPTTTNNSVTKSFSIPSPSATSQPSDVNPANNDNNKPANSNNEENFHTKILKSFNKEFK